MGDYNDAFMRNQNSAVRAAPKGQNRANVLQLKLIGQSHPTGLTANLLKLFEPRPPLEFKPPPEKRKMPAYSGMAQFVNNFAEPGDPEYAPPVKKSETPGQKRARIHKLRLEKGAEKAAEDLEKYDTNNDPNISGDPYKTLFVARLNFETTESRIKREFESFGPVKRVGIFAYTQAGSVRLVTDKETKKPKGYAFIEYMHTRDMKAAYKQADGRKIDGRRVLVDVERGRTVPNWRPRRLGGGLGTTRVGGEDLNQREVQQSSRSSRSEEPRPREDRLSERDREKSRERGRDREKDREKSGEHSQERPRDRDHREDRHHRDRDKERERGRDRDHDRDRDRDRARDRDRGRDRARDYERDRDRDRGREHDRDRVREREYEVGNHERERSHDRDLDYDRTESKHERDRHGERDYDHNEQEDDSGWYDQKGHGHRRSDAEHDQQYDHYDQRSRGQYDPLDVQGDPDRYGQYAHHDDNRYGQMDEEDYRYDRGTSESREYRRSERSHSRDYDN